MEIFVEESDIIHNIAEKPATSSQVEELTKKLDNVLAMLKVLEANLAESRMPDDRP